jgi:hypothetical protein
MLPTAGGIDAWKGRQSALDGGVAGTLVALELDPAAAVDSDFGAGLSVLELVSARDFELFPLDAPALVVSRESVL